MTHDPHIVDAVRRMKGEGLRNFEISLAVGLSEGSVEWVCTKYGIKRASAARLELPLGAKLMEALHEEARRREVRFDPFMRRMLLLIVQDNLFSAILDDGK